MPWILLAILGGGFVWALSKQPTGEPGPPFRQTWPPADGAHMPRNCWLGANGLQRAALMLIRLGYLSADSVSFPLQYTGTANDPVKNALMALARFSNDYGYQWTWQDFGASAPMYDSADADAYNTLSDVYAMQFGNGPSQTQYLNSPDRSWRQIPPPPNPPCDSDGTWNG